MLRIETKGIKMNNILDKMGLIGEVLPSMILGLKYTIFIFIMVLIISIPIGFVIAAIQHFGNKAIKKIISIYIYIMRGTPLLLQLMFVFFGLPYIGIKLGRISATLFAMVLNYAAYYAEIFRGGINSIDKSQFEAAKVLGLSRTYAFIKIIAPQTVKNVFPSLGNEVITLLKDTSLIYILGLGELLKASKTMANYKSSLLPFVMAGVIYLLLTAILTKILNKCERRIEF